MKIIHQVPYFLIQLPRQLFFLGSWSAASIQGRKLFFFEFRNCSKFKQLPQYLKILLIKLNFCCGNYSREETINYQEVFNAETIQRKKLYEEIRYLVCVKTMKTHLFFYNLIVTSLISKLLNSNLNQNMLYRRMFQQIEFVQNYENATLETFDFS